MIANLPADPAPITPLQSRSIAPGEVLTAAFRDPRWRPKLGLLILLGCIPGLNLIAWLGYQQSIAHNRARGSEALPSWDDWADILVRGLVSATASGLYFLPAVVLFLLGKWSPLFTISGILWVLIASQALYAAHIRSAQSDQAGEYGIDGWRDSFKSRRIITIPGSLFVIGWLAHMAIFLIAFALTPIALLTLIGVPILWSAMSVFNGYLIGQVAATHAMPEK